jgi:hypothetical protein
MSTLLYFVYVFDSPVRGVYEKEHTLQLRIRARTLMQVVGFALSALDWMCSHRSRAEQQQGGELAPTQPQAGVCATRVR